jgi:cytochrome c2
MNLSLKIIFSSFVVIALLVIGSSFLKYTPPKGPGPIANGELQVPRVEDQLNEHNNFKTNSSSGGLSYGSYSGSDGKKLFKANCSSCHFLDYRMSTGSGLAGISTRTPGKDWVFNYIKDSFTMLKKGDPYALKLRSGNPARMTVFSGVLTDEQIKAIVDFIFSEPGAEHHSDPVALP